MSNFKDFATGFLRSANARYDQKRAMADAITQKFREHSIAGYQEQMKRAREDNERYQSILAMTGNESHAKATMQAWIANGRNPNEDLRELAGRVKVNKINQNLQAKTQGAMGGSRGAKEPQVAPQEPAAGPQGDNTSQPQEQQAGGFAQPPAQQERSRPSVWDSIFRGGGDINMGEIAASTEASIRAGLTPDQKARLSGAQFRLPSGKTYTVTKPEQYMNDNQLTKLLMQYKVGTPNHLGVVELIRNHTDENGDVKLPFASAVDFIGQTDPESGGPAKNWDPYSATQGVPKYLNMYEKGSEEHTGILALIEEKGLGNITLEDMVPYIARAANKTKDSADEPAGQNYDSRTTASTLSMMGDLSRNPIISSETFRSTAGPALGWINLLTSQGLGQNLFENLGGEQLVELEQAINNYQGRLKYNIAQLRDQVFEGDPRLSDQDFRILAEVSQLSGNIGPQTAMKVMLGNLGIQRSLEIDDFLKARGWYDDPQTIEVMHDIILGPQQQMDPEEYKQLLSETYGEEVVADMYDNISTFMARTTNAWLDRYENEGGISIPMEQRAQIKQRVYGWVRKGFVDLAENMSQYNYDYAAAMSAAKERGRIPR